MRGEGRGKSKEKKEVRADIGRKKDANSSFEEKVLRRRRIAGGNQIQKTTRGDQGGRGEFREIAQSAPKGIVDELLKGLTRKREKKEKGKQIKNE